MRSLFKAWRLKSVPGGRQIILMGAVVLLLAAQIKAQTPQTDQSSSINDAQKCAAVLSTVRIGSVRLGMPQAELEKAFPVGWKKIGNITDSPYQMAVEKDPYEYTRPAGSGLKSAAGISSLIATIFRDQVLSYRIQLAKWKTAVSDEEFTKMLAADYGIPQNLWQSSPDTMSKQITCGLYDFYIVKNQGRELAASKADLSSSLLNPGGGGLGTGPKSAPTSGSPASGKEDGLPPAKSGAVTELCQSGQPDANLKIISKPRPAVTMDELKANNIQGTVRLKVVFSADGHIDSVSVVNGLPDGISEKAAQAAKLIKFVPAQKCGTPVTVTRAVEYNFTIY